MLSVDTVGDYLADRHLTGGGDVVAWELAGGISNIVLAVDVDERHWVVKQSLPQLRVASEWKAKQERTLNEARGLAIAAEFTPAAVPAVVDVDATTFTLVIERAPDAWLDWKRILLVGAVDTSVASLLGEVLGRWHKGTDVESDTDTGHVTASARDVPDDPQAFAQLRVDPYYWATAAARPEHRDAIERVVQDMRARRRCLVHGDFSPKNVLVGRDVDAGGVWVVDFEVTHLGDPSFDVAFMLSHLIMKAVHRSGLAPELRVAARCFRAAYDAWGLALEPDHVAAQVGCLLLARVAGQSPAEYLDFIGRAQVERIAVDLLDNRAPALDAVLEAS